MSSARAGTTQKTDSGADIQTSGLAHAQAVTGASRPPPSAPKAAAPPRPHANHDVPRQQQQRHSHGGGGESRNATGSLQNSASHKAAGRPQSARAIESATTLPLPVSSHTAPSTAGLLNFQYQSHEQSRSQLSADSRRGGGSGLPNASLRRSHSSSSSSATSASSPPVSTQSFLSSSFRLLVDARAAHWPSTQRALHEFDRAVDWDAVRLVLAPSTHGSEPPACAICLDAPLAPKITRCGHAFCYACVVHYMSMTDQHWRRCPLCFESVRLNDLRALQWLPPTSPVVSMEDSRHQSGSAHASKSASASTASAPHPESSDALAIRVGHRMSFALLRRPRRLMSPVLIELDNSDRSVPASAEMSVPVPTASSLPSSASAPVVAADACAFCPFLFISDHAPIIERERYQMMNALATACEVRPLCFCIYL